MANEQSPRNLPGFRNCGYLEGSRDSRAHAHPEPQLIVVLEGRSAVVVDGKTVHIDGGAALVVPPRVEHQFRTLEHCRAYYLRYQPAGSFFDSSLRTIEIKDDPWIPRWLQDLHRLKKAMPQGASELADGVLYALLKRLQQIERETEGPSVHPALRKVMQKIEADISAPLTVAGLARDAAVSPSYLTTLFRRRFGCGPMQYVMSLRMTYAARQLQDPYLSVKEVGYQAGFDDPNYFARSFRKFYQCSPSEYRKKEMVSAA